MCGRFAQSQTREEYLAYLAEEADVISPLILNRSDATTWRQVLKFCC